MLTTEKNSLTICNQILHTLKRSKKTFNGEMLINLINTAIKLSLLLLFKNVVISEIIV